MASFRLRNAESFQYRKTAFWWSLVRFSRQEKRRSCGPNGKTWGQVIRRIR